MIHATLPRHSITLYSYTNSLVVTFPSVYTLAYIYGGDISIRLVVEITLPQNQSEHASSLLPFTAATLPLCKHVVWHT